MKKLNIREILTFVLFVVLALNFMAEGTNARVFKSGSSASKTNTEKTEKGTFFSSFSTHKNNTPQSVAQEPVTAETQSQIAAKLPEGAENIKVLKDEKVNSETFSESVPQTIPSNEVPQNIKGPVVQQNHVSAHEKPSFKNNPITEFFSGLKKKKSQNPDVTLPSQQVQPSSTVQNTPFSTSSRFAKPSSENIPVTNSTPEPKNTSEAGLETGGLPDSIILEDVPPAEVPLTKNASHSAVSGAEVSGTNVRNLDSQKSEVSDSSTISASSKENSIQERISTPADETRQTELITKSNDEVVSEIEPEELMNNGLSENTFSVKAETVEEEKESEMDSLELPSDSQVPASITTLDLKPESDSEEPRCKALAGMDPDEKQSEALTEDSEIPGWNQEIPELEFMEDFTSKQTQNVSPRSFSEITVATPEQGSTNTKTVPQTASSTAFGSPSALFPTQESEVPANIEPQYGTDVNIPSSDENFKASERATLKITSQTPETMLVGVEATLVVDVHNPSGIPSEKSYVEVEIPDWVDVIGSKVEKGSTVVLRDAENNNQHCIWNLGTLLPDTKERLILTIIPKEDASANFHISWSNRGLAEESSIHSEIPQLELAIRGDESLPEGKITPLFLSIENTGNCVIRDLELVVNAEGCEEEKYYIQGIPSLLPGEKKLVDFRIRPNSRQKVRLRAEARINNRLFARTGRDFNVDYMDVRWSVVPPKDLFVGMEAEIPVQIENVGTATAKNVKLRMNLPEQVSFIDSTARRTLEGMNYNQITLELNEIPAGSVKDVMIRLNMRNEGNLEIPTNLSVDSQEGSVLNIPLSVTGVANIRLEMGFPAKILSSTESNEYEIQLTNTGSKVISDAQLFLFFSPGVEPEITDGNAEIMNGGVVSFNVPEMRPEEVQTFHIQVKAEGPGNYPIRCQLKSESSNIDLIQQETAIYR